MSYEKFVLDGKVAVLISPGYGAGWYSWNKEHEGLAFDKELVELLLQNRKYDLVKLAEQKYPDAYVGGVDGLEVVWVDQGTQFEIDEYDGHEQLQKVWQKKILTA